MQTHSSTWRTAVVLVGLLLLLQHFQVHAAGTKRGLLVDPTDIIFSFSGTLKDYMADESRCLKTQEFVIAQLVANGVKGAVIGTLVGGSIGWLAQHPLFGARWGFRLGGAYGIVTAPEMKEALSYLPSERLRDIDICKIAQTAWDLVEPVHENFKYRHARACGFSGARILTINEFNYCFNNVPAVRDSIREYLETISTINKGSCLSAQSVWENYNRQSIGQAVRARTINRNSASSSIPFECDGESLQSKFPNIFP